MNLLNFFKQCYIDSFHNKHIHRFKTKYLILFSNQDINDDKISRPRPAKPRFYFEFDVVQWITRIDRVFKADLIVPSILLYNCILYSLPQVVGRCSNQFLKLPDCSLDCELDSVVMERWNDLNRRKLRIGTRPSIFRRCCSRAKRSSVASRS